MRFTLQATEASEVGRLGLLPHSKKKHEVRFGDLRARECELFSFVRNSIDPFTLEKPFQFDNDWSASSGWYTTINAASDSIILFPVVFSSFSVCTCKRFKAKLISHQPHNS